MKIAHWEIDLDGFNLKNSYEYDGEATIDRILSDINAILKNYKKELKGGK